MCEEENGNLSPAMESLAITLQIYINKEVSQSSDLKEELIEDETEDKCDTKTVTKIRFFSLIEGFIDPTYLIESVL